MLSSPITVIHIVAILLLYERACLCERARIHAYVRFVFVYGCLCVCVWICVCMCAMHTVHVCLLLCIQDTKMHANVREIIFVKDTPHRKSLVSENDFSGDLGIDANGNLKVWTLGLPAGYFAKIADILLYPSILYYTEVCHFHTLS